MRDLRLRILDLSQCDNGMQLVHSEMDLLVGGQSIDYGR